MQTFWQKINLKLLILSVYNEVKTYIIKYIAMDLMKKINQHLRLILIGVGGVATISVNPNTRSTGAATISINPA